MVELPVVVDFEKDISDSDIATLGSGTFGIKRTYSQCTTWRMWDQRASDSCKTCHVTEIQNSTEDDMGNFYKLKKGFNGSPGGPHRRPIERLRNILSRDI